MHQEEFSRDSRSFLERSRISFNIHSNMIELKSISRWTRTRRKISPIIWPKQSTFDTERIGGSFSMNLEKPDRWEIVLTSTMRWPHYTVYTNNLKNNNSGQCHSGNINDGTNHRVLPPAGGNGAIPGGAHDNLKESPQTSSRAKLHDRTGGTRCLPTFHKTSNLSTFKIFYLLQLDRLQLTAVCRNRRGV